MGVLHCLALQYGSFVARFIAIADLQHLQDVAADYPVEGKVLRQGRLAVFAAGWLERQDDQIDRTQPFLGGECVE